MKIALFTTVLFVLATASAFENADQQTPEEIAQARAEIEKDFSGAVDPSNFDRAERQEILRGYENLDPKHWVPANLLQEALLYFDANKSRFKNQNYITIVDFSPRSNEYRFFLIDMKTGKVERYHTTHGKGSDVDNDGYAESFGNENGSGKSSLGYVRTAEVYSGNFGPSVRLDGLSSTNSNLRARAVVFHGWDGVKEGNYIQGLSRGCITMDWAFKDAVLEKIKEGSFLYVGLSK
jgi:hypothetical protein